MFILYVKRSSSPDADGFSMEDAHSRYKAGLQIQGIAEIVPASVCQNI